MNEITTVGADIAKEVIVVCAADAAGRAVYFKQFSFAGFAEWAANLPPCVIGMEACSSAHHWARFLSERGHTPKLMAAEMVAPFRMSRGAKNDRNDAQAILCAVRQPNMRFVTAKSIDQQAVLAWHRARSGYLDERKALLSRTRGLLAEFGVWVGRSAATLTRQLPRLAQDEQLPGLFRPILAHTLEHLWNELREQHRFHLLCTYSAGAFADITKVAEYDQICAEHTHVLTFDVTVVGGPQQQAPAN